MVIAAMAILIIGAETPFLWVLPIANRFAIKYSKFNFSLFFARKYFDFLFALPNANLEKKPQITSCPKIHFYYCLYHISCHTSGMGSLK